MLQGLKGGWETLSVPSDETGGKVGASEKRSEAGTGEAINGEKHSAALPCARFLWERVCASLSGGL